MSSRRRFLAQAPAGLVSATALAHMQAQAQAQAQTPPVATAPPPGAPPTMGTAPATGPEITPATFAEAEKLMRVTLTDAERALAARTWSSSLAGLMDRRHAPRRFPLPDTLAPASQWDPALGRSGAGPSRNRFVRSAGPVPPLPAHDADIAFAPVTHLSRWLQTRALSSERLTRIYLARIQQRDARLRAVITLTADHALAQARQADREIAAGRYRGPLHGIPYGVKDLLDTAGIPTTYGAEPFRQRVPTQDSAVVRRLQAAGAVLIAKLSLGALAMNDVWFGGQTMNPWLPEEGASGSSAGSGSATAAGLVAFAIGSETGGSIISPSMRCGVTGLRPTFGRVARTGAMTLCWSLDKLGPMTRSVEDAMLVLHAISGPDAGDPASRPAKLSFDARASVRGLRLGYVPAWMNEAPAIDVDRQALDLARSLGLQPTPIRWPDWPCDGLNLILFAEAAAAFEELTLSHGVDQLQMQGPDAWPNFFRMSRFLSAVDFVQADRLRRAVAQEMARVMSEVDVLLVPSLREDMLTVSNHTGHPSLTLRTGFTTVQEARSDWAPDPARPVPRFATPRRVPHGVTLIGRLFEEGVLAQVGLALERAAGVAGERPPGF
ncbi:amidase [Roseateles sp. BYS87W]|uniref:Amidase n=1 Tax=Pelomonas baiyunensis TaxID=3299026 RepID=A0ABW7GVJ6_9BURK